MSYLGKSYEVVPIGGLIPVTSAVVTTRTPYLKADGSDITAATYPLISGSLPASTSATLRAIPVSVNLSTVGFGNGLWIAANNTAGTGGGNFCLSYSTDGDVWTSKMVQFQSNLITQTYNTISQIKYLNGNWYAILSCGLTGLNPLTTGSTPVGANTGAIFRSTDGFLWTQVYTHAELGYHDGSNYKRGFSLKYLNGLYIAVVGCVGPGGASGVYSKVYYSSNGTTWQVDPSYYPTNDGDLALTDIAWNGTLYVMVAAKSYTGYTNTATVIPSGTWTNRTNATGVGWTSVEYGNSRFIATHGFSQANVTTVGYSLDGITWSTQTVPSGRYHKVIYRNSLFVAIGYGVCATSPDGITWTGRTVPNLGWTDIDYSATQGWVAVANNYANVPAYIIKSTDGFTWTQVAINQGANLSLVSYGTGFGFLTMDQNSMPITSSDGLSWTQYVTTGFAGYLVQNAAGTIALLNSASGIKYSTNLTSWTASTLNGSGIGGSTIYCLRWLNDRFILFYGGANIYYSLTGITFNISVIDTGVSSTLTQQTLDAAYGNGMYVAVGMQMSTGAFDSQNESRITMTSTDGVTWAKSVQLPTAAIWSAVAYGNGVFVALTTRNQFHKVVQGGVNASSFWSATDGTSDVVGTSGRVGAVSTDGISWTMMYMPIVGEWNSITFNGHVFIAIDGLSKSYAVSKDGYSWNIRTAADNSSWNFVASNTSTNVSVAVSGDNISFTNTYTNYVKRMGSVMRITESGSSVMLPYVRPQEGVQYAVRVK